MSPVEVALAFVDAINSKDIEKLAALMSPDHVFIDGDGSEYGGRERMKTGWKDHLEMIPDLTLSISAHYEKHGTAVLIGWSSGTFVQEGKLRPENSWRIPSAWRVVVESEKVAVWQLFAHQHVLHAIYDRIKGE